MSEDVFEGRFPAGYGGIVEGADGKLFHVAAYGSTLAAFVSDDGGRSWAEPAPLQGPQGPVEAGKSVGLTRLASGALAIHYCTAAASSGGYDGLFYRWSGDEGATWSERVQVNLPGATAWPHYDVMIQSRSGRLVLPVRWCHSHRAKQLDKHSHTWFPEMDVTFVYFSDDEGRTWSRSDDDLVVWFKDGYGNMAPCDEPTVAQMSDGNLILFMRTTLGRVAQSISEDDGETWSLVELNSLCNSYSPVRIRSIPKTGDLHCVWNNVTIDENRRGFRRSRLTSAVSRDNAASWEGFRNLECCSAIENVARVVDREEPQYSKSAENFEGYPTGYVVYRYADAFYAGDRVIFMYSYEQKVLSEGAQTGESDEAAPRPDRYAKLVNAPIDWLYDAGQA